MARVACHNRSCPRPIVTLTTRLRLKDYYVAAMKAVLHSRVSDRSTDRRHARSPAAGYSVRLDHAGAGGRRSSRRARFTWRWSIPASAPTGESSSSSSTVSGGLPGQRTDHLGVAAAGRRRGPRTNLAAAGVQQHFSRPRHHGPCRRRMLACGRRIRADWPADRRSPVARDRARCSVGHRRHDDPSSTISAMPRPTWIMGCVSRIARRCGQGPRPYHRQAPPHLLGRRAGKAPCPDRQQRPARDRGSRRLRRPEVEA